METMTPKEQIAVARAQAEALQMGATDNDYLAEQICDAAAGNLTTMREIGMWLTGEVCPDKIQWFDENDFTMVEMPTGSIEVARETIDNAANPYEETRSGKVTHKIGYKVLPSPAGKLWQKFLDIQIRNSTYEPKGKLYQNYSNGGMHVRDTWIANDGSWGIRRTALNVKTAVWPDVMTTDFTATDASFEFEVLVEHGEIFEMFGAIPADFAQPSSVESIDITYDEPILDATTLTIPNLVLIDPNLYAYNTNIKVVVTDESGATTSAIVESGTDAILNVEFMVGKLEISMGYYMSATQIYFIKNNTALTVV